MWAAVLQSMLLALCLGTIASVLLLRICHRPSFLSAPSASGAAARRIGLVIAHPDDESMFFVPTLAHLRAQGHHQVFILCLSTGNADGLGLTRVVELRAAAALLLNITPAEAEARVTIVDDEDHLADGMQQRWGVVQARGHIEAFVKQHQLDTLITFDERGVSDHPNHIATFDAVKSLIRLQHTAAKHEGSSALEAYALLSTPLWRKYAGLADALCSWRDESRTADAQGGSAPVHFVWTFTPWLNHHAMAAHRSQFVWYRRLFVIFSRYTFFNTLTRIQPR